ncbi:MAG: dihydrodipicolinate synthase family protein [Promethearchaeota archaeon]
MVEKIKGLIAAPLTAFKSDGSVNLDIISNYADFLVRNNVAGVFVNGTTGEGLSLSVDERERIAERWVDNARPNFKVLVHVGHTSLEETRRLARHAADIGAFGIGTIGPLFFKPSNVEDLVNHCSIEAAAAPDTPYYYYHVPSMSGVCLSMIRFLELADEKIPSLAGIKYTYELIWEYNLCLRYKNRKYDMLWGRDEMLLPALTMGARGAIGSTYNIAAPLYNEIVRAFNDRNLELALKLQQKSIDMIQIFLRTKSFISALKHLLGKFGLDFGRVRSPLKNISKDEWIEFEKRLSSIGFFKFCCENETDS